MKKMISTAILSTGIALSTPAQSSEFGTTILSPEAISGLFAQEKIKKINHNVKDNVFQLVGNKLIPTTYEQIKGYKTYDCKKLTTQYGEFDVYLSDKKNIIPTDFYKEIDLDEMTQIFSSPKCKK